MMTKSYASASLSTAARAARREPAARRLVKACVRIFTWPARVMQARRDFATLAGMTDHELADIGLSRQDLRDMTALPSDEDPTTKLADRRTARRG